MPAGSMATQASSDTRRAGPLPRTGAGDGRAGIDRSGDTLDVVCAGFVLPTPADLGVGRAARYHPPLETGRGAPGLRNTHEGSVLARDIVYLRDLKIPVVIGIYEWERRVRQTVHLDIELAADISRAAATEDIADTLNYKAVSKRLIAFVAESRFQLVETLAERICELVMTEFDVPWVRLTLNKKGAIRGATDVGVIIERGARN